MRKDGESITVMDKPLYDEVEASETSTKFYATKVSSIPGAWLPMRLLKLFQLPNLL